MPYYGSDHFKTLFQKISVHVRLQSFLNCRGVMHLSGVSQSNDQNDTEVLRILLKLSDIRPPEWEPPFPFLDLTTVSRVSQSVSHIISKGRLDLKKQLVVRISLNNNANLRFIYTQLMEVNIPVVMLFHFSRS